MHIHAATCPGSYNPCLYTVCCMCGALYLQEERKVDKKVSFDPNKLFDDAFFAQGTHLIHAGQPLQMIMCQLAVVHLPSAT